MALGKYKVALKDYERVYKVKPNDADAKKKFTECKKIVQQNAFQKGKIFDLVLSIFPVTIHRRCKIYLKYLFLRFIAP